MKATAPAGFVFNQKTHTYMLGDRRIPSLTGVLTRMGFIESRWFSEQSRNKGTLIHEAIAMLAEGDLDWESVDKKILGKVRAADRFFCETKSKALVIERPMFHGGLWVATTPDLVLETPRGLAVVDNKSGAELPWHPIQTAIQKMVAEDFLRMVIPYRMSLYLKENGTYDFKEHADRRDITAAFNIIGAYHALKEYGPKEASRD
jgi:hypothetical protein